MVVTLSRILRRDRRDAPSNAVLSDFGRRSPTAAKRAFFFLTSRGDGGCLSCGGSPFAAITYASSFVADRRTEWDDAYDEPIWYGDCAVRRVRSA
jgi:hypothetical protein